MSGIYATPRTVSTIDDCYFYHTMEIPGYGTVVGEWDLREGADKYLGGVDVNGKRVLDIGAASGFLSFYMESQGADVIAFDLSEDQSWDVVPYAEHDHQQRCLARRERIRKLNNAFWFAHDICKSKVRMIYGSVYEIPSEIGLVDISVFGSILLHVRDPFLALERALALTRDTVIITDVPPRNSNGEPAGHFLPDFTRGEPWETWWTLSPELIQRFIGVLGFESSEIKFHEQTYQGGNPELQDRRLQYTVVGRRTKGAPLARPGMELERVLAEKDALLAERDTALAERDGLLAEKDGLLAERDVQLAENSRRIADLESRLTATEDELRQAWRTFESVTSTLGYRSVERVRAVLRWLFPPDSWRRWPYRSMRRLIGGGADDDPRQQQAEEPEEESGHGPA